MAKVSATKNAVLIVAAMGMAQAFAHETKVPGEGGKETTVFTYKLADGTEVAADQVAEFRLTDADSIAKFNELFANMPTVKGGYYSYVNDGSFTNPEIVKTFSPQGLGKIMAQCVQAATIIQSRGGADADEMKAIMDALASYSKVAAQKIEDQKASSLADEIAKLNMTPEQKAAFIAKLNGGAAIPNATVAPNEAETEEHTDNGGNRRNKGRNKRETETASA